MSEMIERVAKAIAADIERGFPRFTEQRWEALTELARQTMRQRARMAIEAMREPTEAMLHEALIHAPAMQANEVPSAMQPSWEAAIDKALE